MVSLGRPVWSGQIRLSLVALPVKLYTATESASKLSFHQVHEPSGKRIRYEKVAAGIGPVKNEDIIKGYEYEKGRYVLLDQAEIDAIKIDAKKTLELVQFVDHCEIDAIYFDRPYYVVPQDELAEDAFRVVRDALKRKRKVGLGQIVMRGREYIGALKPCGKGLLLETLRFEDELRKSDHYFEGISDDKSDEGLVSLAEELIERKAAPFDASVFKDRYSKALLDLVKDRIKGRKTTVIGDDDSAPKGGEVVDLMEALKKSLGGGAVKGRASKAKAEPEKRETKSSSAKASDAKTSDAKSGKAKAAPRKRASKAA
jgi:DNA end-binding protein Ku